MTQRPAQAPPTATKVVLVVDDDDDLRAAIVDVLRQEGFETIDARDGAQAIERALQHRPDVLLLDYRMPNGTGTEVLKELRDKGLKSATILMTAAENVGEVLLRLGFGHEELLMKPFGLDLLVSLVDAAVPRARRNTP